MIALKIKANLSGLKSKIAAWVRCGDARARQDALDCGAEFTRRAMRFTPPGNGRRTATQSLAALRRRIKADFEGDGQAVGKNGQMQHKAFSEDGIRYRRDKRGRLCAWLVDDEGQRRRVSPFRIARRKPSAQALRVMASQGVRWVENVDTWVRNHRDAYEIKSRRGTARLVFFGTRHITSRAAVRRAIRTRQARAGMQMAGWKALARLCSVKLPAQVDRQPGRGSAHLRRSGAHKSVIKATNVGKHPALQDIIGEQMPDLRKRFRRIVKGNKSKLARAIRRTRR